MAVVGYEVKNVTGLRCGIQVLAAANKRLGHEETAALQLMKIPILYPEKMTLAMRIDQRAVITQCHVISVFS